MDNIPVTVRTSGTSNEPKRAEDAPKRKSRRRVPRLIALVVIILLLAGGLYAGGRALGLFGSGSQIENNRYQALFLTNGQVYFGKLQIKGDTYVLSNIFYLQTTSAADSQNPQKTDDKSADSSDNVNLIKLGSEVHGPEDKMIVNREQVLFFENLKKDGKVSASIDQYATKQ